MSKQTGDQEAYLQRMQESAAPHVNPNPSHVTGQNKMVSTAPQPQAAEAGDLRQKLLDLKRPDHLELEPVIEAKLADLVDLFAAEHARQTLAMLEGLREKIPEKFIVNGKEYKNSSPVMIDKVGRELGFNAAIDQTLAVLDAEIKAVPRF